MRSALIVASVVVYALAGCLGDFPATIPVVLVEDEIYTEPGKMHDARFGPHCAAASYQGTPMKVHLNSYGERGRPKFVLLRRYLPGANISIGIDGSLDANWSDDASGMIRLAAPILPATVFANVTWTADAIRVDGKPLAEGQAHERRYEYTAANLAPPTREGRREPTGVVVEAMRFTLHPDTRVTWDDGKGRMCA